MEILGETRGLFAKLMDGNAGETDRPAAVVWEEKLELVEQICSLVSAEWQRQGLIRHTDLFLQNSLEELMKQIKDPQLASLPWLYG